MTRLHIRLSERVDDFHTAASRIHDLMTVDIDGNPDAIVTDDNQFKFDGKPVLLVNAVPLKEEPWQFPALPWRFAPDVQAIAKSLHAGKLGEPGLLRLHDWAPPCGTRLDTSKLGAVDLACWLFDEDPDSLHGVFPDIGPHACSIIHLGFPGDGMAVLDFTNALPDGDGYRSLILIGSRGTAYADDHHNRNLFFTGGTPEASPPKFEHLFIQPMLEDFIAGVREGRDSSHSADRYRKAMNIVTSVIGTES